MMTWPWVAVIGWLALCAISFAWLALEARRAEYEHRERLQELEHEIAGIVR